MSDPVRIPWLIDTHVWLWLLMGDLEKNHPKKFEAMQVPLQHNEVYVSAISMWEVAMLDARKRIALPLDCLSWLVRALNAPGIELEELSPQIAVASTRLEPSAPQDPSDRIILASAMSLGALLVTHDRGMLAYARAHALPHLEV